MDKVSGMLAEIGGGMEDDKVLQALIALLILMALLQGAMDASGSQPSIRGGNGLDGGAGPLLFASSYSKTTIHIEQTSITSTYQMPADSAGSFDLGRPNTLGGAFDSVG